MKAKLIFHEKVLFPDGAILEMVLWQLPVKTKNHLHGLKYRLHYGLLGKTLVRYENEKGKATIGTLKAEKSRINSRTWTR